MQFLKNLLTLTIKELRSLFKDVTLMVMIVVVFTVTVYTVAEGISTDVRHAPVGVVDYDHSTLTHQISDALQPPFFQPPIEIKKQEVDELMDKGKLIFVLEFPPGFERDVLSGHKPEVQLLIDATTMTQAGVGQVYISQIFSREVSDFLNEADPPLVVEPVLNVMYNPNRESRWYMPVMEIDNMITLLAIVLSGAAVIRERERGTIEHLLVMPVTASEIVFSKILANSLVILVASMLSMGVFVQYFLNIPLNGSLWLYGFGVVIYLFSTSALGIMLATIAPTMPQFGLLMLPIYVIALLFSGATAPRSNMPELAQTISEYWPTTQFVDFSQNVLFRNAGIDIVWPELLVMAVIGIAFVIYALSRFKNMLERLS